MDIKDILLLLATDAPNQNRLAVAARLGREHGALVAGVCCIASPPPPLAEGYAIGHAAVAHVVDRETQRLSDIAAPVEAAFHMTMQAAKAPCVWARPAVDELPEETALRARTTDLTIVGRAEDRGREDVALAESFVLAGGTACLIVPEMGRVPDSFDRVILAWNGSREAKRALDDGLVFLKRARAVEVVVAYESGDPVGAPQAQALLAHLGRHDVQASVCRTPRSDERADAALRRRCEEFGADLLVMGAYSHSRAAERILGGVTRSMLSRPPIPILTSR